MERIGIERFLELRNQTVVLDVRSPGEYAHAHIPGAVSLPLFTNEERKVVGTAYKQASREEAIKIGLEYFGPRMRQVVEQVEALGAKEVLVHCWRGGMRSGAIAWLLDLYGFKVSLLDGGYKAYRNWVLRQIEQEYRFKIVGGYTGTAKTDLLYNLIKEEFPVIDLEGLASHKGSALGGIGMPPQPSQEHFENTLAMELARLKTEPFIILEDESQRIGNIQIPNAIYQKMKGSTVYFLDVPVEERLNYLVVEYGKLPIEELKNAILRIQKRLGGLETKNALSHLDENNLKACFEILLRYYDKWYLKGLLSKSKYLKIETKSVDIVINTQLLKSNFITEQE
ncbi:tRNA 2-selenouridine synthase [Spirosomataceae bacterium TFI 002]|nr:tRNA 2-selenouridine synthase [Spirosomataceae bacterium TFI 002]